MLNSLPKQGIQYVVNVGSDFSTLDQVIALTEQYSYIYGAIGVHPGNTQVNEETRTAKREDWTSEMRSHRRNRS